MLRPLSIQAVTCPVASLAPAAQPHGPSAGDVPPGSRERREAGRTSDEVASELRTVFGEILALRVVRDGPGEPPDLSLAHTETVARALRGALLRFATDPPPAALSGHERDGRRLESPHAAFLALPIGGAGQSLARIAGVAVALPRGIAEDDRREILLAASRWEQAGARLLLGRLGVMQLARVGTTAPPEIQVTAGITRMATAGSAGLEPPSTWIGPSRHWASVTPIALHRNPGDLASSSPARAERARQEAHDTIAQSCEHIGLPRPLRIDVTRGSRFASIPPAAAFMPYPRHGSGFKRVCVHVALEFSEPVLGPVVLGVGRYFGVGLCAGANDFADGRPIRLQRHLEQGQ